jgi:hypothetical protein
MLAQTFACALFPITGLAQIPCTNISLRAKLVPLCCKVRPKFEPVFSDGQLQRSCFIAID